MLKKKLYPKWGYLFFLITTCLSVNCFGLTIEDIDAEAAILMDAKTGSILFEKNSQEIYYPASITKLMTALLTIENLTPLDTITFSAEAIYSIERNSSHISMQVGEEITVDQALHGLLLESANEVANGLAETISGSIDAFAETMTARAKALGAQNTHFSNPNGLHEDSHYTTAYDMALITRELYANEYFLEIMSHTSYQIPPTNKMRETRYLAQQHTMLNKVKDRTIYREDVIGGKTGYTDLARNTLVTVASSNNIDLIVVLLKGSLSSNYKNTSQLLDYGFSSYQTLQLHKKNDVVSSLPIYTIKSGDLYQSATASISVPKDQSILVKKDTKAREIATNLLLPEYLTLGVESGEVVGKIQYLDGSKIIAENDLILSKINYESSPYKTSLPSAPEGFKVAKKLFFIAFCTICLLALWFIRVRRSRRKIGKSYKKLKVQSINKRRLR